MARPPRAATKGSTRERASARSAGLRAARCRFTGALPKRGFTNIFKKKWAIVNLGRLEKLEGDTFNPDSLLAMGVIRKAEEGLKVLGTGQLTRKITVEAHQFSKSALEKIQQAGGTAQVIGAATE